MKRIDTDEGETYWKIALAGPGGTGKTGMGVSAPRPIILLSERQGMPSIKQAAKRLGVPMPTVLLVEEADDYRVALLALRGKRTKPFKIPGVIELPVDQWPLTAVIDSLTDACDVLVKEIRKQAPQRPGRDGLPVDAGKFWGTLIDRAMGIIKGFRDLPMNVVFLCLLNDKIKEGKDGEILERVITPKLATKDMAQSLCAAVNVLAYTYRTMEGRTPKYGVMTIGPEGMLTKPCEPLQQYEVPDLSSWIRRLNGAIEDVAPVPPPESTEEAPTEPKPSDDTEKVVRCTSCDEPAGDNDWQLCDSHFAAIDTQGEPEDEVPPREEEPPASAEAETVVPPASTEDVVEKLAGALAAQSTSLPANDAVEPPPQVEAPTMVPCLHCKRRMGVKGYNEGKRRPCDDSAGHCEPDLGGAS